MRKYYNSLKMEPDKILEKLKASDKLSEKFFYGFVFATRAVIIFAFCVLFVSTLTHFFGEENQPLGVVLVVMVLTLRFVHFGYCITDTLINLAIMLAVFTFAPALSLVAPAWSVFFIHIIAMFILLLVACQKPQMGLGGLFGFSYCYLVGNAVTGELLVQRSEMALVGFIICGAIMVYEHRHKDRKVRFRHLLFSFDFKSAVSQWQVRMAVGVGFILALGQVLNIPRFMWMGFACSTMLARFPLSKNTHERFIERIIGIVVGSVGFMILCLIFPNMSMDLIGMLGGIVLGYFARYTWKTIIICFGALSVAAPLYGVVGASIMRIVNNVFGAVFAMLYARFYDWLMVRRMVPQEETKK